jgi:hypothetical protein
MEFAKDALVTPKMPTLEQGSSLISEGIFGDDRRTGLSVLSSLTHRKRNHYEN